MSVRLVSLFVLSTMACGCFTGCDAVLDAAISKSEAVSYESMTKKVDKSVDDALKGVNQHGDVAVPMSEFFANPQKYNLWSGDRKAFQSLGEKCIAAGAPAAYALPSKEDGLCDSFAIALPSDKAARAQVFDTYNQFWKETIKVPTTGANASEDEQEEVEMAKEELDYYLAKDVGQKYIFFAHDN